MRPVFEMRTQLRGWDATSDGQRFLANTVAAETDPSRSSSTGRLPYPGHEDGLCAETGAERLPVECDTFKYHMKTASIRDLRYRFSIIETLLNQGEEIQITKRKRVIARLTPIERPPRVELPDFLARLRKIYGKKMMKVSGAELLAAERDRY